MQSPSNLFCLQVEAPLLWDYKSCNVYCVGDRLIAPSQTHNLEMEKKWQEPVPNRLKLRHVNGNKPSATQMYVCDGLWEYAWPNGWKWLALVTALQRFLRNGTTLAA